MLQGPRGRDEEVSEAAQPIASVEPLSHAEHLPEHCGRRGLKRWVEVRECVLDVGVEGFQILKRKRGSGNVRYQDRRTWTLPQAGTKGPCAIFGKEGR